jgi:parvulin-like peptidyl-prolyl isomerase
MAKKRTSGRLTKKHLARAERERRQRRWILISAAVVALTIIGLLIAGWVDYNLLPVATINGENISSAYFRGRVRLYEAELINQMIYQDQQDLIAQRLEYKDVIGQEVLNRITEDVLIRQEVQRRGIEITEADVDRAIAESFGYYPQGTPTRIPTSTPNPTDIALASITPTITEGPSPTASPTFTPGPSPTITPTRTPFPTPTLITEESYLENFNLSMETLKDLYGITETDFREQYRALLYRQKLYDAIEAEVPREQEQVHARHILVETEETALLVLRLLEEGGDWDKLASEYSTDVTNKDRGGDLGWFPRGVMIKAFEDAAFSAQVGEIVGPIETDEGWHLIEVLDKGLRQLDDYNYQLAVEDAYNAWVTNAVSMADVEIRSNWEQKIPPAPDLQKILSSGS